MTSYHSETFILIPKKEAPQDTWVEQGQNSCPSLQRPGFHPRKRYLQLLAEFIDGKPVRDHLFVAVLATTTSWYCKGGCTDLCRAETNSVKFLMHNCGRLFICSTILPYHLLWKSQTGPWTQCAPLICKADQVCRKFIICSSCYRFRK